MEFFWKDLIQSIQLEFWMSLQKLLHHILILLMEDGAGAVNQNASLLHITGEISQYRRLKLTQSLDILLLSSTSNPGFSEVSQTRNREHLPGFDRISILGEWEEIGCISLDRLDNLYPQPLTHLFN